MQDQIPENQRPYEPGYFSAKPNGFVLFMRTFLPWQLIRFAALNLKIMRLLMKGHN